MQSRRSGLSQAVILLAVGLGFVWLAGCKVGPDYERPEVKVSGDWRWKPAEPKDEVLRGAWWKVFRDPALDQLQALAGEDNQDLKAAMARVEQARASARMSRSELFPTLDGTASWVRYRTSGNSPSPVPFPIPSFQQESMETRLDLSYEIDLWGKVRRGFESARAQAFAMEAARQSLLLTLQADVAINYFALQRTLLELDLLQKTIAVREDALEVISNRVEVGLSGQFDFERGKVEVESVKANLAGAQHRRAELEHALAVLCGGLPSRLVPEVSTNAIYLPRIAPDLPSALLERRPDVAQAERELAARNAEIGVAIGAFFPVVRLTTGGGYLSGEFQDLYKWDSRVWNLGPSVSLPLFAGGRNKANLERARAVYEEGVARYRQKVLVAFEEVEDNLAALQFLEEQVRARTEAATAATNASQLAYDRYRAGAVNFLEIVDAEQARLQNEVARVLVTHEQLLATVRLIKALGGGWTDRNEDHE